MPLRSGRSERFLKRFSISTNCCVVTAMGIMGGRTDELSFRVATVAELAWAKDAPPCAKLRALTIPHVRLATGECGQVVRFSSCFSALKCPPHVAAGKIGDGEDQAFQGEGHWLVVGGRSSVVGRRSSTVITSREVTCWFPGLTWCNTFGVGVQAGAGCRGAKASGRGW